MSTLSSQTGAICLSLHMSEEEFVRWTDEDTHAEWVAGRVEVKMPIPDTHDQIQFWMRSLIQAFVQRRNWVSCADRSSHNGYLRSPVGVTPTSCSLPRITGGDSTDIR